jgi:hypothetical protein
MSADLPRQTKVNDAMRQGDVNVIFSGNSAQTINFEFRLFGASIVSPENGQLKSREEVQSLSPILCEWTWREVGHDSGLANDDFWNWLITINGGPCATFGFEVRKQCLVPWYLPPEHRLLLGQSLCIVVRCGMERLVLGPTKKMKI